MTGAEDWLPIETAPRDGTPVDLWVDHRLSGKGFRIIDCVYQRGWARDSRYVTGGRYRDENGRERYDQHREDAESTVATHWRLPPVGPEITSDERHAEAEIAALREEIEQLQRILDAPERQAMGFHERHAVLYARAVAAEIQVADLTRKLDEARQAEALGRIKVLEEAARVAESVLGLTDVRSRIAAALRALASINPLVPSDNTSARDRTNRPGCDDPVAEAERRGAEAMRERAAKVAETPGRTGREWVPESLWGSIAREIGSAIRALTLDTLKDRPLGAPAHDEGGDHGNS